MDVFFFASEKLFMRPRKENSCFFWYSKGLTSYYGIETILSVSKIHIEKSILEDFTEDYSYLLEKFDYEVFDFQDDKGNEEFTEDKYCFFASNDTIVYLLNKVYRNLADKSKLFVKEGEGAKSSAVNLGLECSDINGSIPEFNNYRLLILGNDWGLIEQKLNYDFIQIGKNTVCVQESVLDFNVADMRMRHSSFPVFQGIVSLKNFDLNGKICAVIGNPRYEDLEWTEISSQKKVLINVNFTYGIYENERAGWIDNILEACSTLDLDYLISQHPRDTGDLSKFKLVKTNAGTVHDVLKTSSVLITRFSSLIFESLCLGRPVIYYNPHGETHFYEFEPDNKCLFYATNKQELLNALDQLSKGDNQSEIANAVKNYLRRHLGTTTSGNASAYIGAFIDVAAKIPPVKQISILNKLKLDVKVLKRRLLKEKI